MSDHPNGATCCAPQHTGGPGYASPLDAFRSGPREKILYVPCVYTGTGTPAPDYLATIDVDPSSPTFQKVIHRLPMPRLGDELHHMGWNACSSCFSSGPSIQRRFLVLPALTSGNVYFIDVLTDPRAPRHFKTVEGAQIVRETGMTFPHTAHCLADGNVMVSMMGGPDGSARGNGYLLLDGTANTFNIRGKWGEHHPDGAQKFGYDFWYQPRRNVMVATGWGDPQRFTKGFNPADVAAGHYGNELYIYDWKEKKLLQTIPLGEDGLIPLEVRFLHEPTQEQGFVGAALSSAMVRFFKDETGKWRTDVPIKVEPLDVEGWALPKMPGLTTDFLISLDDRFLYMSNWLHGDIRQYDISDPANPKLAGRVFIGGSLKKGGGVTVRTPGFEPPEPLVIRGVEIQGGPQMIQLSLDGRRLYATTSLFSAWDKQFYPELVKRGSCIVLVDVDPINGGMSVNKDFLVNFGDEPHGPALAHEVRYPGGDCTSDIWV